MYEKILNKPLEFGEEFSDEARSILTSLLNREPTRRLGVKGAEDIKRHPFFHNHIDFKLLAKKKIRPPFKPSVVSPVVSIVVLCLVGWMLTRRFLRMCPTSIPYSRKKPLSTVTWRTPIYRQLCRPSSLVRSTSARLEPSC